MKTDLASLPPALTAQPGVAAQVSVGGGGLALAASMSAPDVASGNIIDTTAMTFQAALASQVKTASPTAPRAPIKPGLVGYLIPTTVASALTVQSEMPDVPSLPSATPAPIALAPVAIKPPLSKPTTLAVPAPMPAAITTAHMPAPAAAVALQTAPLSTPANQPATLPPRRGSDGQLPNNGNILPVDPIPAAPVEVRQQATARAERDNSDDAEDDKSTSPVTVTDPSPSTLALMVAAAQPVAPPVPTLISAATTPAARPAPTTVTTAKIVETLSSLATTSSPVALAPASSPTAPPSIGQVAPRMTGGNPATPALTLAAALAPAPSVAPAPVISFVPAAILPPSAPVSLAPIAPDPSIGAATVTPQPVVVAVAAPALTNLVPSSLPNSSPSTASRLARQSGMPRSADLDAPADNGSDTLSPAVGVLPVAANPVSDTTSVAIPAASPPQDFAALVDRLLEARASAQSSTAPQQISTSVTHADFGKVSLTFQQDTAGLSVSMTSADPGFARAAQSAIATSGQIGTGQAVTANQLSSGHSGGQSLAGNQGSAGSFSQGFAQPDTPAPVNSSATGHSASFSTSSGGSQQSQAQAQPQQRPGFIAAANRMPTASGSAAATDPGQGIFA